jgi:hypothetical protein
MSLNVLVIPEDFRKDRYVLAPLVRKLFQEIGKPRANVLLCVDPLIGGIEQALNRDRIAEVIGMYPQVHIFLLLVDRDGMAGRRQALRGLETHLVTIGSLRGGQTLIGENAWQEIEVWALAGQDLPSEWSWKEIRDEVHPKERYFEALAKQRGLTDEPGEGRTTMGREAAQNYTRVRSRCPENIQELERRLKEWLALK